LVEGKSTRPFGRRRDEDPTQAKAWARIPRPFGPTKRQAGRVLPVVGTSAYCMFPRLTPPYGMQMGSGRQNARPVESFRSLEPPHTACFQGSLLRLTEWNGDGRADKPSAWASSNCHWNGSLPRASKAFLLRPTDYGGRVGPTNRQPGLVLIVVGTPIYRMFPRLLGPSWRSQRSVSQAPMAPSFLVPSLCSSAALCRAVLTLSRNRLLHLAIDSVLFGLQCWSGAKKLMSNVFASASAPARPTCKKSGEPLGSLCVAYWGRRTLVTGSAVTV
jgi:hypothetical protein